MLRKYSNHRTYYDNLKLGTLSAFSAGMVNVLSVIIFFAFTSNITGHYAILAQELSKGNWIQAAVVFLWILTFFTGSMISNLLIIHGNSHVGRYVAHAIPLILEIICILIVGLYLQFFYTETLYETELLVTSLLFAMGLQNGLTASISNGAVKTTHLTGLTTDLAITLSMLTKERFRNDEKVRQKGVLLFSIMFAYMLGATIAGIIYYEIKYYTFYIVCFTLCIIMFYDYYKLNITKYLFKRAYLLKKVNPKEEN
ncbi:YoaK family protein [Chishuiella sp.]|uniref:YoaK family protein n=1 Tax=Chishuiella sp. TaxID=1969467 RepID=UPI0028A6197C|nr:YoaK family protein [Chishuiella sp.]